MGGKRKICLSQEDRRYLEELLLAQTEKARTLRRAKILLMRADGHTLDDIAEALDVNRNSVVLCLTKYAQGGIQQALVDKPGRGRQPEISEADRAWVCRTACRDPKDLGYEVDRWTYRSLTDHVNRHATSEGYPRLANVPRSTVYTILTSADIRLDQMQAAQP